jgi:hypothetical protein
MFPIYIIKEDFTIEVGGSYQGGYLFIFSVKCYGMALNLLNYFICNFLPTKWFIKCINL